MANAFYFKCKQCNSTWKLEEGTGWLDEHGNFGYSSKQGGSVIGNPTGQWEPVSFVEKLCLACNGTYIVLSGNSRSYPVIPLQPIGPDAKEIRVTDNASNCPACKLPMYSGRELLDHVINRDRCSKFMISRIPSSSAVKCPACKEEYLRYDNAGISSAP